MSFASKLKDIASQNTLCVWRPGTVGELVIGNRINLFAVENDDVHVIGIHGKITVAIGANATTVQLFIIPTGGAQQALSLASGTLTGLLANTFLEPTGAVGAAIAQDVTYGVGIVYMATNGWTLTPGIINILIGGATTTVGAIDWYIQYRPLKPGARIIELT